MKFRYNCLFLVFSSFFVPTLFAAERSAAPMNPHIYLLFDLAAKKQWSNILVNLTCSKLPKQDDGSDFTNEGNFTLLHLAVQDNQEETVKILLDRGADPSAHHPFKQNDKPITVSTPLHFAAKYGYITIAQQLIENKPEGIHSPCCGYNNTPLHVAAWFDKSDMIKFLIDKGADIAAKNNQGSTPIHFAVWRKHENSLNKLLECCSPDKTVETVLMENEKRNCAFDLAQQIKSESIQKIILSYLLQHLDVDKFLKYTAKFSHTAHIFVMPTPTPAITN